MEKELEQLASDNIAKKEWEKKEGKHDPNKYSRELRWNDYQEEVKRKEEADSDKNKNTMFKEFHEYEEMMKPKIPEVYAKDGHIIQCNQG